MRHLTFLRVYLPLEQLPTRVHDLARAATKLSRADIEAEAAERLDRRLRPDSVCLAPLDAEPPIIRTYEVLDPGGNPHHLFHVEYLARAAFESAQMRRKYYDDELYERLVPKRSLQTLQKVSELQAEAKLISRPLPTFQMQLWNISLAWLVAFGGEPPAHYFDIVNEMVIHGTPVVHRVRDLDAAIGRLSWVHGRLAFYGPDGQSHPLTRAVGQLQSWLNRHRNRKHPMPGLVELDYGALSRYAWPDTSGAILERGFQILDRAWKQDEEIEDDEDTFLPGLPPAMLNHAAEAMRDHYQRAVEVWDRIQRYECAN